MSLTKVSYSMMQGAPINVLDYGADSTGTTDSTTAIQAAINAGGAIYIPTGTYLISARIYTPSDKIIYGDGASSVLKVNANLVFGAFGNHLNTATRLSNITIQNLMFDGGGQTTDIYTGISGTAAIYYSNAENIKIDNVTIKKFGVVKSAVDPQDDALYGGYGIFVESRHGELKNIRISNCTIFNIAGGGVQTGDGIAVNSFHVGTGGYLTDVQISNCWVSTCGRHCVSFAGGFGETIPSGPQLLNTYCEKSAFDGIDMEEAYQAVVDGCYFNYCGNDQTYYDPVAEYGPTNRLLAGLAVSNDSKDIVVTNSMFLNCYYGITYGANDGLIISNCTFRNSTTNDLTQGLAGAAYNFKITDCNFYSTTNVVNYFLLADNPGFSAKGCTFYGTVVIAAMADGVFDSCMFKKGMLFGGSPGDIKRNTITDCVFSDFVGIAIDCTFEDSIQTNNSIENCIFSGDVGMTYGIKLGVASAVNWSVKNNLFINQTVAGIGNITGLAYPGVARGIGVCSDNTFQNCENGILITSGGDFVDFSICNNTFSGIGDWCISLTTGADNLTNANILGNLTQENCVNGLEISVAGGVFDYVILANNNFHTPSGTKWSVSAGNANGIEVNNITT